MSIEYVPELTAAVSVTDLDAAIAWYEKVLGFQLLFRMDDIGWCELSTGMPGVTVGLGKAETVQLGGGATTVFGVKDIKAAKAVLDSHGVKQDGDIQTIDGMVHLLTFYDLDGNAFMFSQSLMPA
jgi:predicted enzyme related to lactoylglutathione lyase